MDKRSIFLPVVGLMWLACSGGSELPNPSDVGVDSTLDATKPDTAVGSDDGVAPPPDVPPDTVTDTQEILDVPSDTDTASSCHEFGCPCQDNTGCFSTYCVASMDGRVCSKTCGSDESCPRGWFCAQIGGLGGDTTFVCQAPATLCRPCRQDADCVGNNPGDNLCIAFDQNGSYCGVACSITRPCLDGYACVTVSTNDGPVEQCRPASQAECPCTDHFAQQAFLTDCRSGDDPEVCQGTRTCDQDCQVVTHPEICDGHDNDCDGVVDQNCNADGDAYCTSGITVLGPPWPAVCPSGGGDCDDERGSVHPGAGDDPDDLFADTNCDGIDGDASRAWFVADSGSDTADGTKARPKKTIQAAIDAATGTRVHVYVSVGTYNETVTLRDGVSVYGGYDVATGWARSANNVVTIQGGSVGLFADGISRRTVVDRITVRSGNGSGIDSSSYAMVCRNSSSALEFLHVAWVAGNGADGLYGSSGTPGPDGVAGSDGARGCENDNNIFGCKKCSQPQGGGGGQRVCTEDGFVMKTTKGGRGGNPGLNDNSGGAGAAGDDGTGGAGGAPGLGPDGCPDSLNKRECQDRATPEHTCQGTRGSNGLTGDAGTPGTAGASFGTLVESILYVPAAGGVATTGRIGKGAGGGGGGAGGDNIDFIGFGCDSYGSAGGGGGSGGCGGTPGVSGSGGGGSFGVFLFNASPKLVDCSITTGNGGRGGNRGAGGAGGTGGAGGKTYYGFDSGGGDDQEDGGCGGFGGTGGNGGQGGQGAGGGGGPSVGLVKGGTSAPSLSAVSFSLGVGGTGGTKGGPGGNDGAAGYTAQVYPPPVR